MSKRGEKLQAKVLAVLRRCHGFPYACGFLGALRDVTPKIVRVTIYRVLAALMQRGGMQRLGSLKAGICRQCEGDRRASALSIFGDVGTVLERVSPGLLQGTSKVAGRSGVSLRRQVIALRGFCGTYGAGEASA